MIVDGWLNVLMPSDRSVVSGDGDSENSMLGDGVSVGVL